MTRTKKDLYHAMVANGFVMPGLKSQIVTLDFMESVRQKLVWCPKKEDLRQHPQIGQPPPIQEFIGAIQEAVNVIERQAAEDEDDPAYVLSLERLVELIKAKSAPKQWLIVVLAALAPDHQFFQKKYAFRKQPKQNALNELKVLANEDAFYDDLPLLPSGRKQRNIRLTKQQRLVLRIAHAKAQQDDLAKRLSELEKQMADSAQNEADRGDNPEEEKKAAGGGPHSQHELYDN